MRNEIIDLTRPLPMELIYLKPWPTGSRLEHGQCVVVQLRDHAAAITESPGDYWIGVCCFAENLLPEKFVKERPAGTLDKYTAVLLLFKNRL